MQLFPALMVVVHHSARLVDRLVGRLPAGKLQQGLFPAMSPLRTAS
ncbi:hypothetical protein ACGFW5_17565 [Streptomyces sp. NPDC048416]